MKEDRFYFSSLLLLLVILSSQYSILPKVYSKQAYIEIQCDHKRTELAYLLEDELLEGREILVDSSEINTQNYFKFRIQAHPHSQYWIRIGANIARFGICLVPNDSLVFREDTINGSFQLIYDHFGANKKQERMNQHQYDSVYNSFFVDSVHNTFIKFMKYICENARRFNDESKQYAFQFPEHLFTSTFNNAEADYYERASHSLFILEHEKTSDISNFEGCDPKWSDTISLAIGNDAIDPMAFSFVDRIIRTRLIHEVRKGRNKSANDPRHLKLKFQIVLKDLVGLARDYMISDIASVAGAEYDASVSTPLIKEMFDTLVTLKATGQVMTTLNDHLISIRSRQQGQFAKDISLPDINGKQRTLSEFKGKVVLLHFWGTWCNPCREQLPQVVEFERKHLNDTGLVIISIALEYHNLSKWKQSVSEHSLSGVQLYADGTFQSEVAKTYFVNAAPTYILLDREGKFISSNEEAPPSKKLEKDILQALKAKR